jgi:hypothetical protein
MKFLAKGSFRKIYALDKNLVLKVQVKRLDLDLNTQEWDNWLKVKDIKYAKYYAPCVELRKDKSLVMVRCQPIDWTIEKYRKTKIPLFMKDNQRKNFALLNGKVVCIDYHYPKYNPKNFSDELHNILPNERRA